MKTKSIPEDKIKIIFKCTSCDHEEIKEIKCGHCGGSMVAEEEITDKDDVKELHKEYEEYQSFQGSDPTTDTEEEDLDYDGLSDFGEPSENEDIDEKDFYQV